ncbi:MAG: fused response regulator/phosphatase [Spirochaetes bacterium]|nr:fused response regulator/phosphatase [Spirochaetota bacterium]MBU0955255.1 fused response regulator/phosphatase [Spirochaetota bacterium]
MSSTLELILVDDEPRVTAALERELRQNFSAADFGIRSFNNPVEAIAYLKAPQATPFLVLSDLRMPQMTGAELLRQVREQDEDIQTILLTAYSDMADIRKAVSTNIRCLMEKPWDRYRLEEEIRAARAEFQLRAENRFLKDELQRQLWVAADFQKRVLAPHDGKIAWPQLDVFYKPLERLGCGGDYYDVFQLRDGRVVFLLADVVGHGIKAALITIMLKTLIQGRRLLGDFAFSSPSQFLTILNSDLCRFLDSAPDTLVAMGVIIVDPQHKKMRIANAGLPAIHLIDSSSNCETFSKSGPALAFAPDKSYSDCERSISPNDVLILFTDGLNENEDSGPVADSRETRDLLTVCSITHGDTRSIAEKFRNLHPDGSFSDDVTIVQLNF